MGIEFEWIEPTGVDDAIIDALFELHGATRRAMARPARSMRAIARCCSRCS